MQKIQMDIFMTIKKVIKREDIEFKAGNQPIKEYFETHEND